MNKEEFIKKMRSKLSVLEDQEIDDIVSEYVGYIDEKVASGKTEAEAIKELGNFDEIINDTLAAYKVKKPTNENKLSDIFNNIINGIDNFIENLDQKSAKDIIRIIIEIGFIFLVIWLLKIPFNIISNLGENLFRDLSNPIGNIFGDIWKFIVDLSYLIVSIILFLKIIEKRYFKKLSEEIITDEVIKAPKTPKNSASSPKVEPKIKEEVPKNHSSISNLIINICLIILKIFCAFILFGLIVYLIGMAVTIGIAIYLLAKGVSYYGILILLISLFLGGAFILKLIINFLVNHKVKALNIVGELLFIIILTGLGLTFSAIEIASTEIIYNSNNAKFKTISKSIPMQSDLEIYGYDSIEIDNTLNDIKIEYSYPEYLNDINIEIVNTCHDNYICLGTNITDFNWSRKYLDTFIENLKAKKIYVNDYVITKKIYLNSDNYNILMNNNESELEDITKDIRTFTRTFNVLDVNDSNDGYYIYLTLRAFQDEEIATVKVLKDLADIEPKNNYEFTFRVDTQELKPDFNEDKINDLFTYCNLLSIKKTNRLGLDQIQESLWS